MKTPGAAGWQWISIQSESHGGFKGADPQWRGREGLNSRLGDSAGTVCG
ncbi:hypothetical protein [Limnohabitans sp. Jir72]|nr:hypothetical protein [Limnohabitans sp. Jir72]